MPWRHKWKIPKGKKKRNEGGGKEGVDSSSSKPNWGGSPSPPSAGAFGALLSPKASPSPLLYILEVLGVLKHNFPTCNSNLYLVVLPLDWISAELGRSPAGIDHHHHRRAVTLPENSSTSPSLLLDQEGGDRHRAVRVLNTEVPSVRC